MLTPKELAKIKRAVSRLLVAAVEYDYRGINSHDDVVVIERQYKAARRNYTAVLKSLTLYESKE